MKVTAEALNKIADILNITDKNTVIQVAIATLVKSGVDMQDAMDAVLGKGAYLKMAGAVYDKLNAKA